METNLVGEGWTRYAYHVCNFGNDNIVIVRVLSPIWGISVPVAIWILISFTLPRYGGIIGLAAGAIGGFILPRILAKRIKALSQDELRLRPGAQVLPWSKVSHVYLSGRSLTIVTDTGETHLKFPISTIEELRSLLSARVGEDRFEAPRPLPSAGKAIGQSVVGGGFASVLGIGGSIMFVLGIAILPLPPLSDVSAFLTILGLPIASDGILLAGLRRPRPPFPVPRAAEYLGLGLLNSSIAVLLLGLDSETVVYQLLTLSLVMLSIGFGIAAFVAYALLRRLPRY